MENNLNSIEFTNPFDKNIANLKMCLRQFKLTQTRRESVYLTLPAFHERRKLASYVSTFLYTTASLHLIPKKVSFVK